MPNKSAKIVAAPAPAPVPVRHVIRPESNSAQRVVWKGLAVVLVIAACMVDTVAAREGRRKIFVDPSPTPSKELTSSEKVFKELNNFFVYMDMIEGLMMGAILLAFYLRRRANGMFN